MPLLLGVLINPRREDPEQHQVLMLLGDKEEAWGACPRRSPWSTSGHLGRNQTVR